jgi:hypothetical protein
MSDNERIRDLLLVISEYQLKELRIYKALTGNPEDIALIELQKLARPGVGISTELIDRSKP